MGLFDKFRSASAERDPVRPTISRQLRDWAAQRTGVEAFVEPETSVTPLTVVLVAADGEWTRRPAGGPAGARRLGEQLGIPVYDVQKVGYPQRMRDYDARAAERRACRNRRWRPARRAGRSKLFGTYDTATQPLEGVMATRHVESSDGTRIAVYEEGNPDGPAVVLVHGWPDSHVLWDGVVPLLAEKFRVIRYDNRGAGASSAPAKASAYAMARFADDFAAVIAELCPGQRVHVIAHDWGSAGMWEYVARPEAADRVASFTSVSGPSRRPLQPLRPRRPEAAVSAKAVLPRAVSSRLT